MNRPTQFGSATQRPPQQLEFVLTPSVPISKQSLSPTQPISERSDTDEPISPYDDLGPHWSRRSRRK